MTKTCSDCSQEKSVDDFHKSFKTKAGEQRYFKYCKVCASVRAKGWYQNNLESARERGKKAQKARRDQGLDTETRRRRDYKNKYGITLEEWKVLYESQKGLCAICSRDLEGIKVCTDHDHATGLVRGLLCTNCNQGLGYFSDNADTMIRGAHYLLGATKVAEIKEVNAPA
jgi:Recombination endonuclease VII